MNKRRSLRITSKEFINYCLQHNIIVKITMCCYGLNTIRMEYRQKSLAFILHNQRRHLIIAITAVAIFSIYTP